MHIQLNIYLQKIFIYPIKVYYQEGMLMNISEGLQGKLDVLFVTSIAIFIIVFWFLIIPGA